MPDIQGTAPKPSGASDAEPTASTLKTWVFTVGTLIEARSSKIRSDLDKSNVSACMRYVTGNLKDMIEELEKYAVKNDDWPWLNLVGKFRLLMRDRTASTETNKTKPTLDSLRTDVATALNLVEGCAPLDFPTTDDAHLADCVKYIATSLTGISKKVEETPLQTSGPPWDGHTLKGKVNLISKDRLALAAELKSVKAAYNKLRKDLTEEAGYTIKDDKERRRRLQWILAGRDPNTQMT